LDFSNIVLANAKTSNDYEQSMRNLQQCLSSAMFWQPIPSSSFYNLPSGPPTSLCQLPTASEPHSPSLFTTPITNSEIDPSLMAASPPVRQSAPATPAAPSMDHLPPSKPSSKPVPCVSKGTICKEFLGNLVDESECRGECWPTQTIQPQRLFVITGDVYNEFDNLTRHNSRHQSPVFGRLLRMECLSP